MCIIGWSWISQPAGYLSQVQDAVQVAEFQQVRTLLHSSREINSWCQNHIKTHSCVTHTHLA